MPKLTQDIVEAASRCSHFNMGLLDPNFIVIRSPYRRAFAVISVDGFHAHQQSCPTDDWEVALKLSSEHLLALMGLCPPQSSNPDPHCPDPIDPDDFLVTPDISEVIAHASSPKNL